MIQQDLSFPNSGANETPGVIVLRLDDSHGPNVDPRLRGMVIVFNATPNPISQQVAAVAGQRFELNPYQRTGSDPIVKQAGYQAEHRDVHGARPDGGGLPEPIATATASARRAAGPVCPVREPAPVSRRAGRPARPQPARSSRSVRRTRPTPWACVP